MHVPFSPYGQILSLIIVFISFSCNQSGTQSEIEEETTTDRITYDLSDFDLQGHRGARTYYPENTIQGAIFGVLNGATTIECDVVITKDNVVVLSHEPWLDSKICLDQNGESPTEPGQQNNIYLMTYQELQNCDCGSMGHPDFPLQEKTFETKPALDSLFEIVFREIDQKILRNEIDENVSIPNYNIEIKSDPEYDGVFTPSIDTFVDLVINSVSKSYLEGRITIQSFDPRVLNLIHERMDQVYTAFLIWDPSISAEDQLSQLTFIPDILSPNHNFVNQDLILFCEEKGMKLIPWTVNDSDRMEELIDLGVNGIISDDPILLKDVVNIKSSLE